VEAGLQVQSLLDVDEGTGDAGTKLNNPRFVKKHPISFEGRATYQVIFPNKQQQQTTANNQKQPKKYKTTWQCD